jgi:hypothetical protein
MEITKEKAEQMRCYPTRRFCFDGDDNAEKQRPKYSDDYKHGRIEFPFERGIKNVFPQRLWAVKTWSDDDNQT